jgi:hypothetical protein
MHFIFDKSELGIDPCLNLLSVGKIDRFSAERCNIKTNKKCTAKEYVYFINMKLNNVDR